MGNRGTFDQPAFVKRLRILIEKAGAGRPGTLAAKARKDDPGLSNSLLAQYLNGTIPGLDKALALARAGGVSLDYLAGGEGAPGESKYREALRAFVRRELENTGLADTLDLSDDVLLEKLVDNMLQTQPQKAAVKKKKKTGG
jgi:transcriptional regulator with XRE-family HTH domain